MSDIPTAELKTIIRAILKTADLQVVSAKKVREQAEKQLNCSLMTRKKELDAIVMEFINEQQEEASDNDDDDDDNDVQSASEEEGENNSSGRKRPQPTRKISPKKKRKSLNASDSGTESEGLSDGDYVAPKKAKKEKSTSSSTTTGGRKVTGFTRAYDLSPELSAVMGVESLPRHEVVRKVWALIKERNLYDPKNKQFAICDDELYKVMRVKRFRIFGMLKHLKPHFIK